MRGVHYRRVRPQPPPSPSKHTDLDPASRHDVCDAPFVSDLLLFVRQREARRNGERRNGQKEEGTVEWTNEVRKMTGEGWRKGRKDYYSCTILMTNNKTITVFIYILVIPYQFSSDSFIRHNCSALARIWCLKTLLLVFITFFPSPTVTFSVAIFLTYSISLFPSFSLSIPPSPRTRITAVQLRFLCNSKGDKDKCSSWL